MITRPITGPMARAGLLARECAVLVRSGVLGVASPPSVAGQLRAVIRFGPTLAGSFAAAAARAPGRCAVQDETTSRTYAELDQRVRALARGLAARGVTDLDTVAVLGRNSVAFVEALVATSRLGADALLLSTFLSPVQAREVLLRHQPTVVLADPELLPLLTQAPDGVPIIGLRSDPAGATSRPDLDSVAQPDGDDPPASHRRGRLIVLTSGTTGTPKGARRPAPSSLSPAASMLSRLPLAAGDTIMIASPLFHTWALGMLQIAPALAATVVLRERSDAELVLDAVARTPCTALIAVPAILERILQLPPPVRAGYKTPTLRVVGSSGSALTAQTTRAFQSAFGDVLYNIYGSTEISWATIATPEDLRACPGTAGKPPLGTRLEILDDAGERVPPGTIGRIFVGNDLLFEGYSGGGDKERRHGLIATGDRGHLDAGGRLIVAGREDDLVISGAEKIYPLEVEEAILSLPGVREVAVIGRPDERLGQRLVAYVGCDDGATLTAEQVQDHVRARLARFAVPKTVLFVDALPRTPTGKVVPRLLPGVPAGGPETP
jgi:acyl-CoA synthetase (AMP-forming)/AMP-acid ligase II